VSIKVEHTLEAAEVTISADPCEVRVVVARPARSPALEALLDDGERDRLVRLGREGDRRRFVAAHALARLVLSQVTGQSATTLTLEAQCGRCGGRHGKMRVATAPQMHFGVTHAEGRVAVAVTALGPVGVDLEPANAAGFAGFADVALTPRERAVYERLPIEQRPGAATSWWVRKEAALKATGHAMFVSPEDVEISEPAEEPRLIAWHAEDEPTAPVQLADLRLGSNYVGCVAVLSRRRPLVRLIDGSELLATWAAPVRPTTR
jgi:4'-phosphopantetheinyl transferase